MYKGIHSYPFYRIATTMYKIQEKTHKNLILEPFSCVIRIILLQYKHKGTKISILDNGISYNYPSFVQGFFRTWYGDTREDLHNLCSPIIYFTKWYPRNNEFFKGLYTECEAGFSILKEVYDKNSTIYHTINHYLTLLHGENTGDISESKSVSESDSLSESKYVSESDSLSESKSVSESDSLSEETPNPIIDTLKTIWSGDEITLVVHILALLKDNECSTEVYLRNLEDILEAKETQVHEYIRDISTGY